MNEPNPREPTPADTPRTADRDGDARLRLALEAAGIGTWRVDLANGVDVRDAGLNRILGLPPKESTDRLDDFVGRIHPDDRTHVLDAVRRSVSSGDDYSEEFRVVRPDGTVRWVRTRGRLLGESDDGARIMTGAVIDVTDQRRAEEHNRLLVESAQALAGAVDPERAVADVARTLVPTFAAGCLVHFLGAEGAITCVTARGACEGVDDQQVLAGARGASPYVDRQMLIVPMRAGGRTFGAITLVSAGDWRHHRHEDVAFAVELADRVALAIDHARLFRNLEQANRVKDEFLATLSHELRTPLNAVLGWTRMLRRGTIPPDRTAAILETIERNAAAQMQLVEELLDLSAMVAGGLRLNVTRVDLRDVLGGAIETIRPAADAKSVTVALRFSGPSDEVAADPARMRQVLWNLLSNAVKFTPAGGTIDVTVDAGSTDVEIKVTDTGQGIAPEFLPFVFEPFRQADSSSTRQVGGLGLGLAIVRYIVEAHGGTVSAHSNGPGLGSMFVVRLPVGRAPALADAEPHTISLRGRRVLAVDDDESTQELVATMLLMYGVSVRTAGRAPQALEILTAWRPDVLLADIAMPGEDGYALVRRVRALPPPLGSIPAVALTAYTDPQSVRNAFAAGFDAHLGKPLEPHVLADALLKVLRVRRA